MLLAGAYAHPQACHPVSQGLIAGAASLCPERCHGQHRSHPHRRHQRRRAAAQALLSTREREVDQASSPAIDQLYSDILKEKRRRLESNFDASPDFLEGESAWSDNRVQFERQWTSQSASTSSAGIGRELSGTPQSRRHRTLKGLGDSASRRRSVRYASSLGRGRTAQRRPRSPLLQPYDPALRETQEAAESDALQRLLQVDDKLRSSTGSALSESADFYGIDLHPASVLPRDVEVELTQMIRKAILAEGSSVELQQKLGRRPSAQELADKLGLQSESHLQLLHSNRRAAHLLMLRHNVRLVVHVARKYTHWGVDMVDLVAEGMVGLERAMEKFEPEKGYKFSTYAFWWIRQKVSRCAARSSRVVPIPIAIFDLANRVKRMRHRLEMVSEEPVTDEQVAEAVGVSLHRMHRCLQAARFENSLDGSKGQASEGLDPLDNLAAPPEGDNHDGAEAHSILQQKLDQLLNTLPPRDRNIIRMHYGLHHPQGEGMQLRDISRAYGVCHERVRKIEAEAVQRLSRDAALAGITLPFGRA